MTKKVCIFGSLFQAARSQTALSQWEISVRAGTHLSNVNQVEAGNQEPNVILAVKISKKMPFFIFTLKKQLKFKNNETFLTYQ